MDLASSEQEPEPRLPPEDADIATTWAYLQEPIRRILIDGVAAIPVATYRSLYQVVYNYCHHHGHDAYTRRKGYSPMEDTNPGRMYCALRDFLSAHFKSIGTELDNITQDEDLVKFYVNEWTKFVDGVKFLQRIFSYLTRHFIRTLRSEGKRGIHYVEMLACMHWRDHLLSSNQRDSKLAGATLALVEKWRTGNDLHRPSIAVVLNSLALLTVDVDDGLVHARNVDPEMLPRYEASVTTLLEATERHYRAMSISFLAKHPVTQYIQKAEHLLRREETLLRDDTPSPWELSESARSRVDFLPRLVATCEHVLITEHAGEIHSCYRGLLAENKVLEIHRTYVLLARIPQGVESLLPIFGEHVKKIRDTFQGPPDAEKDEDLKTIHALFSRMPRQPKSLHDTFAACVRETGVPTLQHLLAERIKKAAVSANASVQLPQDATESTRYDPGLDIEALLALYHTSREAVARLFPVQASPLEAFEGAFRTFVNSDDALVISTVTVPRLLVNRVDMLVRKGKLSDDELDQAFAKVLQLLEYVDDRDIFERYYTMKLQKRLVYGTSTSHDTELNLISKLKDVCGFDFGHRIHRLFADIDVSEDLSAQFKDHWKADGGATGLSFSVLVLASNSWLLDRPSHDFTIPPDFLAVYQGFADFYLHLHSGRKLTWLWKYSKNELRMKYTSVQYILVASTYQAAVLCQYNDSEAWSLDDLVHTTSIPPEQMKAILDTLVKPRILVNDGDMYRLNLDFRSKKVRININIPVKAEQEEPRHISKSVEEDRKFQLQATVVRLMKARKELKEQLLLHEVVQQSSRLFVPNIADVKKAIDSLIDREYVKRKDGEWDVLEYVA